MPKARRFTNRHVQNARLAVERDGKPRRTFVFDTPGLYLYSRSGRLLPNGHQRPPSQRWILRYSRRNKGGVTEMSLGRLPETDLTKARHKVEHVRKWLADGINPQETKSWAQHEGTTLGQVATAWIESRKFRYTDSWLRNATNLLKNHAAPLLDLQLIKITSNMIDKELSPLRAKSPFQAKRALKMLEAVFRYAKGKKLFPFAVENPASWEEAHKELFGPLPRRKNFKGMSYWDIPTFVQALRQHQGKSTSAMVLEFTIRTACRSGEALGMQWREIDWDKKIWTIPAERMRARKEHRVPLTNREMELLTRQKEYSTGSSYVFTGRGQKPLAEKNMRDQLYSMGFKDKVTVHGFRSSFKTWATEQTDFPREIIEMCLAHSIGNAVEQAYWRGDALAKRRDLMEEWATFCAGHQAVIPLRNGA